MRYAVSQYFVTFSSKFEGVIPWMYQDVKGLVTVGIGNLIDPSPVALGLPFRHDDGSPATRTEIAREWMLVKLASNLATQGAQAAKGITKLRLNADGIQALVWQKLLQQERFLKVRFPDWDSWPADAQLGLLSMSWAMGPAFHFPLFEAACRAKNWSEAAIECHMNEAGNPGLVARNCANVILFNNAAKSTNPNALSYPQVLT